MSNFVSETNAAGMMEAIAVKKLTVTDVMPAASALVVDIPYLYLGATTQDYTNGSIYKCQEVTPATDPKTYEWIEKYQSNVDLTKYKRIWGGTKEAWDLLPLAEKIQYDYTNFKGDAPTANISGYQKKTLDTPLTIDGTQQTTVEGALGGLNGEVGQLDNEFSAIENVYGAKNLIPYPYAQTTKVENGITYTDIGDGKVTVSGTATSDTTFYCCNTNIGAILGEGVYRLSGCPTGGDRSNGYFLEITGRATSSDTWTVLATDIGEGASFVITNAMLSWYALHVFIRIRKNKAIISPITFKPMIRLASIQDDTWVPYAKTNKELTDDISQLDNKLNKQLSPTSHNLTSQINSTSYVEFQNDVILVLVCDKSTTSQVYASLADNDGSTIICCARSNGVLYGVASLFIPKGTKIYLRSSTPKTANDLAYYYEYI